MYLILFGVSGVGVLVLVTHALLGADPDRSVRKVEWITLATAVAVAAACGVAMFLTAP